MNGEQKVVARKRRTRAEVRHADGRNPGWQHLLQTGLKKTAPAKLFKEWSAKKIVVKHWDPYAHQGGHMPMPCSRISLRNERGKQDKETKKHEEWAEEKPDHLRTISRQQVDGSPVTGLHAMTNETSGERAQRSYRGGDWQ